MKTLPRITPREPSASGTVTRITQLLRVLAEARGDISLGEIAQRINLPASTTHRLLHLLMREEFVDRGADSRSYRSGLELLRLSGLIVSGSGINELADKFMKAVVEESKETCLLSIYVRRSQATMVTRVIYSEHPLRYQVDMFSLTSAVWGATGQGILAFLPDDEIDAIVASEGPSPADRHRKLDVSGLRRELAAIRERGYAYTKSQKVPGAIGMSAPVFDSSGVVAALCITLPEYRFDPKMTGQWARTLVEHASRFSYALGWRDPEETVGSRKGTRS